LGTTRPVFVLAVLVYDLCEVLLKRLQLQDTGQGVGQAGGASTASKYEYRGKGERVFGIAKTVRAVLTYA